MITVNIKRAKTQRGFGVKQENAAENWNSIQEDSVSCSPPTLQIHSVPLRAETLAEPRLLGCDTFHPRYRFDGRNLRAGSQPDAAIGVEGGREEEVFVVLFTPSQSHNSLIHTLENDKLAGDEKGKNLDLAQKIHTHTNPQTPRCARWETAVAKKKNTLETEPNAHVQRRVHR